ncbi:hypothetical protein O3M35_009768 [Rhynocoris fuscipes]|uniref:Uncharacterized protein n=1 Tax=Rhynocoris fuscipes TaxID=488301 RepID=A0AAW1D709_9HEMI
MIAKVYETLIALSGTIIYTSFGILEFTFTIQMSAYLKILQNHLQKKRPKEKMIYKTHVSLVISIDIYNRLFAGQTYLETVVSSLMPCGFILTFIRAVRKYEPNKFDKIQTVVLLLSAPCIVCSCGQKISTEVERLHESSYMNKWYEETPKVRRDLLTLMIRTTKPTTVNYRLFVTFDNVCLATVMQGLYSYVMMIVNFDTI